LLEIDNLPDTVTSCVVSDWLLKSFEYDDSFIYAFNWLIQKENRDTGIPRPLKEINELELMHLLNNATKIDKTKNYIIKNDEKMKEIYTICQEAFKCEYSIFRDAVETADFRKLNIVRQNITQELTYRLSGKMGNDWYSKVCETMKWKKTVCSGQGKKVEDDLLIRKLRDILPRPQKE